MTTKAEATRVVLGGTLAREYGRVFYLHCSTPREAVQILDANFPGFGQRILQLGEEGVEYRVCSDGFDRTEEDLELSVRKQLLIYPVVGGAKSGWFNVVLGVALFFVAPHLGFLNAAGVTGLQMAGVSMALGGLAMVLSPQPKITSVEQADDSKRSYFFNGAVASDVQGNPVQVIYGEMLVAGQAVNVRMETTNG